MTEWTGPRYLAGASEKAKTTKQNGRKMAPKRVGTAQKAQSEV